MSSLYYANALFSKYPAASSVFATGAFPEQTSCAFASNPQRPGYGAGSGASFAASMQGLYTPAGGAWRARVQPASTRPATGSSRVPSTCTAHPLSRTSPGCVPATLPRRRAPRSRGTRTWRPRVTSGSTLGCEAQVTPRTEQSRAVPSRSGPGTFPGRRPLPGQVPLSLSRVLLVGGRPWGRGPPPRAATRRAAPIPVFAWCSQARSLLP